MADHARTADEKSKPDAAQKARFIEAARQLGCDTSEEAFNETLRTIGRAKPPADPKPKAAQKPKPPAKD